MGADQGRRDHRPVRHRGTGPHGRLRAFPPAPEAHPSPAHARAGPPHHPSELTMPQFTASLTAEGLELRVMVGLCSTDMKPLRAAGMPVPRPPVVTGIIDTGSNCCCISARVAGLLGLGSAGPGSTQTAG